LMHMGNLAFIGKQKPKNLIHICLNNEAHESVGGMPTGAQGLKYSDVAKVCGYENVCVIQTAEELEKLTFNDFAFIEIKVANTSRDDLLRPKESALENAMNFMKELK